MVDLAFELDFSFERKRRFSFLSSRIWFVVIESATSPVDCSDNSETNAETSVKNSLTASVS